MPGKTWMIYGAYGYTGHLVAAEAQRRGHKPVLAGRSGEKLIPLARRLGLSHVVLDLEDHLRISKTLADCDLVFNAAGPFVHTSQPLVRACLDAKTHYLDVTGEVPVFENNLSYHPEACDRGIALISGVGSAVLPTDCMAKYVADRVPEPTQLNLAIAASGSWSPGTINTILEHVPNGVLVRRSGRLVQFPPGKGAMRVHFLHQERTVFPISWGDLATANRSAGIPNITTFMAIPRAFGPLVHLIAPSGKRLLSFDPVRRAIQSWVAKSVRQPNDRTLQTARFHVWARAVNEKGEGQQAWLETWGPYRFAALAGVRCVEKVLEEGLKGALTPAQAFGSDFVLEIPGTKRYDRIS